MPVEVTDALQLPDGAQQALRLCALRGFEQGYAQIERADLLGINRQTANRWRATYRSDGLEVLSGNRTGRPFGSGRLLAEEQARDFRICIDGGAAGSDRVVLPAAVRAGGKAPPY